MAFFMKNDNFWEFFKFRNSSGGVGVGMFGTKKQPAEFVTDLNNVFPNMSLV